MRTLGCLLVVAVLAAAAFAQEPPAPTPIPAGETEAAPTLDELLARERYRDALPLAEQAVRASGEEPTTARAEALLGLGVCLSRIYRRAEAAAALRECIEIIEVLEGDESQRLVRPLRELALSVASTRDIRDAPALVDRAMSLAAAGTADPIELGRTLRVRATVRMQLGRTQAARADLLEAEQLFASVGDEAAVERAGVLYARAQLELDLAAEDDDALALVTEACRIVDDRDPRPHRTAGWCHSIRGRIHSQGGDPAAALAAYRVARDDFALAAGPTGNMTIQIETILLQLLNRLGRAEEMLTVLERLDAAVADGATGLHSSPMNEARVEHWRGHALVRLGRTDEALVAYRRGWEWAVTEGAPDHLGLVRINNAYASTLRRLGRADEAMAARDRVVALLETSLGTAEDVGRRTQLHAILARVHVWERELSAFRSHTDHAIALARRADFDANDVVHRRIEDLAQVCFGQEDFEREIPLRDAIVRWTEAAVGDDHPDFATALNRRAQPLMRTQRLAAAHDDYRRSLELREAQFGPDHLRVAQALNALGTVLLRQERFEAALVLFQRGLDIRRRRLAPGASETAVSISNVAGTLRQLGRHEDSLSLLSEAVEHARVPGSPSEALLGRLLIDLTTSYRFLKDTERALAAIEECVAIYERTLRPDHPTLAGALSTLAYTLVDHGDIARAREAMARAVEIKRATLPPGGSQSEQLERGLASFAESVGDLEKAATHRRRSFELTERRLLENLVGFTPLQRLELGTDLRRALWYLHTTAHRAERPDLIDYDDVLRTKGLVARATAAERRLTRRADGETLARVEELSEAERAVSRLANAMPPRFQKARFAAWQRRYAEAAAHRDSLTIELSGELAGLREAEAGGAATTADVQSMLGPDDVLVDVLLYHRQSMVGVVTRDSVECVVLDSDYPELEAAAEAFTAAAADREDPTGWRAAGARVHELFLADALALPAAAKSKRVFLCPDAALASVPLAALPVDEAGTLLIDDRVLVVLSMAQELLPRTAAEQPGRGMVLVGGVDYGKAAADDDDEPTPVVAQHRAPRKGSFLGLPGTAEEVTHVEGLFDGPTVLLGGSHATEAAIRSHAPGARILHVATHGYTEFDEHRGLTRRKSDDEWEGAAVELQLAQGHDPLLLSGLAMAGANERDGANGDDGILTALEASQLDLDGVELVVLSACETGLGRATHGEGVVGLVQAFQFAGASRVVGSLWKVDDQATRMLMETFYAGVLRADAPLHPADALRAAAKRVREHDLDGTRPYAHPHYWAAFSAYGR